ncbi:hypothetical protein AV530_005085 [Patagioenas fasciata monilis]|uniref:Uncharacterized protein n=1 Tax=Patagioenas fasciata monilis TaxID=372326 RepID=A0A1V4K5P2_PATFA|nr:hypothetical protein AV530_005085 [Patagioenas fasciata monilis]
MARRWRVKRSVFKQLSSAQTETGGLSDPSGTACGSQAAFLNGSVQIPPLQKKAVMYSDSCAGFHNC